MIKLVHHIRGNAIAYLALFAALAGTSYAAFRVPANSVGERQLVNHSIDPVKLNPRYLGGYVRKWATVDASGHLIASGGRVKVSMPNYLPPAHYLINWLTRPRTACSTVVSLDERLVTATTSAPGSVSSATSENMHQGTTTFVVTYAADGTPSAMSFDAVLLC